MNAIHRFQIAISSDETVTLPAEYRRLVGLREGDVLELLVDGSGEAVLRKKTARLGDIAGFIKWKGPPFSDQDIENMIEAARNERADEIMRTLSAEEK